jgi:hypothetical protein
MNVLIRFEGFVVAGSDRVYNFSVGNATDGPRQFTVGIPFLSFAPAQLKFQDGPPISLQRVREELDQEAEDSPAKNDLTITGHDIEAYLAEQRPHKAVKKKRVISDTPLAVVGSA